MGEIKGFLKYQREDFSNQDVEKRITHYNEFTQALPVEDLQMQGARCMDCGIPFCQSGCPVDNIIPDWNDLIYRGKWEEAVKRLHRTNNFPEFTGRVCPAPCENSCVLAINQPAVTIKNIEKTIIEYAFKNGFIQPNPPIVRKDKSVAVVGSGPAGLACADQLNKEGYVVDVYDKNEVIGGLLALGIPDFKLDKNIVKRRVELLKAEGINFHTNVNIGVDKTLSSLKNDYDAVVLCAGAEKSRDLEIEGRELKGIHFAMDYLIQQNRINSEKDISDQEIITAKDKDVVVIGGGDTGSDCIGAAIRQGAKSVTNLELLPKPPQERDKDNPWPEWAQIERTSSSHEEGCTREYSVMTKFFEGRDGSVEKIRAVRLKFGVKDTKTGQRKMTEIHNSEFEINADLVLLAMGFIGTNKNELINEVGIKLDQRNNVQTDSNYMTNIKGVFSAGDMRRGQSLVVWAISEGRKAAQCVDEYLNQKT
ncbi:MAG: glutamate synthase subunit beta [Bacteroidota bacterium]